MRYKTFCLLLMLVMVVIPAPAPAYAQITEGYYSADDPELIYDGTGWLTISDGGLTYTESAAAGDSVSFDVNADQLIIYRWLWPDGGDMEICINATCEIVSNNASETIHSSALAYRLDAPASVTITNVDATGGLIRLNAVQVLADSELHQVWPGESTKVFQVINGDVFAIDQTITLGEIVIAIPLFLLVVPIIFILVSDLWN